MTLVRYNLSTNEADYLTASIDKNQLKIPFSFTANNLSMNIFARASSPVYNLDPESKESFIKELEQLPDYMRVTAAVSFSEDLTMDQLIKMKDNSDLYFMWAGIRNAPEDVQRYHFAEWILQAQAPFTRRSMVIIPNLNSLRARAMTNPAQLIMSDILPVSCSIH